MVDYSHFSVLVPVILLCYFLAFVNCLFVINGNSRFQHSLVRLRHLSVVCNDVSYRVSYRGTCIEKRLKHERRKLLKPESHKERKLIFNTVAMKILNRKTCVQSEQKSQPRIP